MAWRNDRARLALAAARRPRRRPRPRGRSSSGSTPATATPDYNPFDQPERVFAPPLLAAINEDARLANGEVGYLDGDPLCQCQDAAGLKARVAG